MTWHLKDRELEKKLIAIDPDFIENLQKKEVVGTKAYSIHFGDYVLSGSIGSPRFYAYFDKSELEDVPEYNPNAWNDSRKVIPPEDVVFRAKIHRVFCRETPYVDYECLTYKDGRWYKVRDGKVRPVRIDFNPGDYVDFKAWDD